MMGVYFAATGFGNKLAGTIGESSQLESFSGVMVADKQDILPFVSKETFKIKNDQKKVVEITDYTINEDKNFSIRAKVYSENGQVVFKDFETGRNLNNLFNLSDGDGSNSFELLTTLNDNKVSVTNPYHAKLIFEKDKDKVQITKNKGDGKDYGVSFVLEEEQSEQEFATFMWLTIFTVAFGLLLLLFLKKLKKLTHGAEDRERFMEPDASELSDN
jgi:hypothetical protein